MLLLFSLFSTFRGGLSTAILFYRFNLVISRKFIRSHWLLAPEIISQERKERKKTLPFRCWANELKVALRRHDIVPLVWDSDLAGNPNPFKTPNGSVPQRGEVVLVTASLGTSKFLGIPNLKNMVYAVGESMGSVLQCLVLYFSSFPLFPSFPLPPTCQISFPHQEYEFIWANISSYNHGEHVVWE